MLKNLLDSEATGRLAESKTSRLRRTALLIIFTFCLTFPIALAEEKTVRVETDAKLEYNKGIDFYNSGQFDKAVDCFRAAIDLEPEYIDAYYNLGMTLDYLKQYEASVSMFKELLKRKPEDYDAVYRVALVSYKMQLPEQTKEFLAQLPVSSPYYYKASQLAKLLGTDMQTIKTSTPKKDEEKVEPEKVQGTFAGNYYYEELPSPTGIVVDEVGYLYVANYSDNLIYRITPTGEKMVFLKHPKINGPIGMAMDESGNLYIANYNSNSVMKLSASHQLTTLIENIEKPYYLYVSGGYLFVSCQGNNTVLRYKI